MWKNVFQVFKFQVLSSKVWKKALQVFEVSNIEVWGVREVFQVSCKGLRKTCFLSFWKCLLVQHKKGESFWGKAFSLQGCKESNSLSKWVGGVEEISSRCCKFFKCEKLVFESIKFQSESVWKKVILVVENFNFQVLKCLL